MTVRSSKMKERPASAVRMLRQRLACLEAACRQQKTTLDIQWHIKQDIPLPTSRNPEHIFALSLQYQNSGYRLHVNYPMEQLFHDPELTTFRVDCLSPQAMDICIATLQAIIQSPSQDGLQTTYVRWGYQQATWNQKDTMKVSQFIRATGTRWRWHKQRTQLWVDIVEELARYQSPCLSLQHQYDGHFLTAHVQLQTTEAQTRRILDYLQTQPFVTLLYHKSPDGLDLVLIQAVGSQNAAAPLLCVGRLLPSLLAAKDELSQAS